MKIKLSVLVGLAIFSTLIFFIGVGFLLFYTNRVTAWDISWRLQQIPGVKVVGVQPSADNYSISVIEVQNKGQMGFSGWSLRPDQFAANSRGPIGLFQIGPCKEIQVISDVSYRGWVQLNREEIGKDMPTVRDAVNNYDFILQQVKSWPKIPSGSERKPGRYANCD